MVKRSIKLFVFAFFWCVLVSTVWAQEFRFTCTSDMQGYDYTPVLNQMNDIVGDEGVFHISPGDVYPAAGNFSKLQSAFGTDVIWIPVMGNHDEGDKDWIGSHNQSLPFDINWGPRDSCDRRTTFSFDYGNAHFVILDEYCVNSGDIDDALYDWLVADLTATAQPAIFVFGHEPAYPFGRHLGDSLDQYPGNRDRFWQLLHDRGVVAYFNGHTHQPSVYQEPGYDPWQVDTGQARGDGWGDGFVDVTVRDGEVEFNYYRGPAPFYLWWHEIVETNGSGGSEGISNVTAASGRTYEAVENGVQDGALVYVDRTYTFTGVPAYLEGAAYIKTANNDKGSAGDTFLSFDVDQDVSVYVAHDDRIPGKPSWLLEFTDTGEELVTTDTSFSILRKEFPAGTITLGGNEAYSMYCVIVVENR